MSNHVLMLSETVLVFVRSWGWLVPNIPQAKKSILVHPMELLGDLGDVKFCFRSETVLILV